MNIDIINIGHYRVTSHGGRSHDLFNRTTDVVYTITKEQFRTISEERTVEVCRFVEESY